ncbi:MAG: FeoB-associated Cys-rich membrane protein [Clostridia bacterium]|nr:FeoB-associated Cys-rich membrane protein [Clostridia bacterium]
MLAWLSANLINIVLVAVIVLIVAWLIRGMIRDRRAGKRSCGGNCAGCGACSGCSACGQCGATKTARPPEGISGR